MLDPAFVSAFLCCSAVPLPVKVSYMILQQVSPVTHSVGNCVKRVIVIVTSVLFFRTPVSQLNAIGEPPWHRHVIEAPGLTSTSTSATH